MQTDSSSPRSPYITRLGYTALQGELTTLWKRRSEVTQALTAAAAEGDRSENAEYIYRKKELRTIDRRIRYLQKRLPELKVVDQRPTDQGRVFFGAWITLEDTAGNQATYRLVGADEFDPQRGYISIDSPVARALLKKSLHDTVVVSIPTGSVAYVLNALWYE